MTLHLTSHEHECEFDGCILGEQIEELSVKILKFGRKQHHLVLTHC